MPELPEVETVVRGLREVICDKTIDEVEVLEDMIIGYPQEISEFKSTLQNKKITGMGRRGKYIILELQENFLLIIHLRMTGKLLLKKREKEKDKHTRVILRLKQGVDIHFNNVRKFGRMYLVEENSTQHAGGFDNLGPEPLSSNFTPETLQKIISHKTASIKSTLLDQKNIAGLGNIYTDEALYRAGIRPDKTANKLKEQEVEKLYEAIVTVLKAGIKFKGTSFSDYVNALGESGDFQEKLMVYGKEGDKCSRCSCEITKTKISGRSTHYCPDCQE